MAKKPAASSSWLACFWWLFNVYYRAAYGDVVGESVEMDVTILRWASSSSEEEEEEKQLDQKKLSINDVVTEEKERVISGSLCSNTKKASNSATSSPSHTPAVVDNKEASTLRENGMRPTTTTTNTSNSATSSSPTLSSSSSLLLTNRAPSPTLPILVVAEDDKVEAEAQQVSVSKEHHHATNVNVMETKRDNNKKGDNKSNNDVVVVSEDTAKKSKNTVLLPSPPNNAETTKLKISGMSKSATLPTKKGEVSSSLLSASAPPLRAYNAKAACSTSSDTSLSAVSSVSLPEKVPFRFIRAERGDIESARRRYYDTLQWRKQMRMDSIIYESHPKLLLIKKYYPHYYHYRGLKNEPCYYESPPCINLIALRAAGVTMEDLLRYYALRCEYMWSVIECNNEDGRSIHVIDLDGIGLLDFGGEIVDFVKRTSAFTSSHYPERSGTIFVLNVPSWFSLIWSTVKPWIDEVTRKKIKILSYRVSKEYVTSALEKKILLENIPPEYGGKSTPLGSSPEEVEFMNTMMENNNNNNNNNKAEQLRD